jgi:hypothetical protein
MLKSIVAIAVLASTLAAVNPAQAGNYGQPSDDKTLSFSVHPGGFKIVKVRLRKSTHYSITARHDPESFYPQVFPPPPHDVKLRVLRFWQGHLKMDKHKSGLGSASMSIEGTHHGDRDYVIKVYNKSPVKKHFRLTIKRTH